MPKTKTTVKKTTKKAAEPEENLCKCYISSKTAGELDGSGEGTGESFWINKLSATKAEVRNNCLCGLCVGDIIEITEHGPSGWNNEVVKIVEKQSKPYGYNYDFPGMDKSDVFPKKIANFIHGLQKKGVRFEGVVKGTAIISRPKTMTEEDFFTLLSSGPMTFTRMKD
jgi:hypothetical protein